MGLISHNYFQKAVVEVARVLRIDFWFQGNISNISTLLRGETHLRIRLIISVAREISRGEKARRFLVQTQV